MYSKHKLLQVLSRQVHIICMTDNDVKSVKKTIFSKVWDREKSNSTEAARRLVETTARYIMESYKEVEGELEEAMETEQLIRQLIRLHPSTNSNIFKSIEEIRVDQLEDTMDIHAERMGSDTVPVKEIAKLIIKYRYMLTRIIKNKEAITNKLWKQLRNNKVHQEVYQQTGPTVMADQQKEDRLEKNLTPHKKNSGKPQELAKGLQKSKEELLFRGGFQKGTKKESSIRQKFTVGGI